MVGDGIGAFVGVDVGEALAVAVGGDGDLRMGAGSVAVGTNWLRAMSRAVRSELGEISSRIVSFNDAKVSLKR